MFQMLTSKTLQTPAIHSLQGKLWGKGVAFRQETEPIGKAPGRVAGLQTSAEGHSPALVGSGK